VKNLSRHDMVNFSAKRLFGRTRSAATSRTRKAADSRSSHLARGGPLALSLAVCGMSGQGGPRLLGARAAKGQSERDRGLPRSVSTRLEDAERPGLVAAKGDVVPTGPATYRRASCCWPAAGSVDTEIGCFREPEANDAEAQV
jgi:hypothetical protein